MEKNTLFTLVDQYGNSLENFKLPGSFTFYYNYSRNSSEVLTVSITSGTGNGILPRPEEGLESTTLVIAIDSKFYNSPGELVYKGEYQAPQNIAVSKKTLDPEQKVEILETYTEDLRQAVLDRIQEG